MTTTPSLREVLQAEVEALSFIGSGTTLLSRIILRHGVEGHGVDHGYLMGTPKECFSNAAHRALDGGFTYVEGYAMRPRLGIPILHAWLLDGKGRIIDVTWQRPDECQYIGLKFSNEVLRRELLKNEVYGLLYPGDWLNLDLLRKFDADLVEETINNARSRRTRDA